MAISVVIGRNSSKHRILTDGSRGNALHWLLFAVPFALRHAALWWLAITQVTAGARKWYCSPDSWRCHRCRASESSRVLDRLFGKWDWANLVRLECQIRKVLTSIFKPGTRPITPTISGETREIPIPAGTYCMTCLRRRRWFLRRKQNQPLFLLSHIPSHTPTTNWETRDAGTERCPVFNKPWPQQQNYAANDYPVRWAYRKILALCHELDLGRTIVSSAVIMDHMKKCHRNSSTVMVHQMASSEICRWWRPGANDRWPVGKLRQVRSTTSLLRFGTSYRLHRTCNSDTWRYWWHSILPARQLFSKPWISIGNFMSGVWAGDSYG